MPRRGFQESAPQGGMAQFSAGAPPAAPPQVATDFSGIQRALAGFTQVAQTAERAQAAADATLAQQIAGTSGIAESDRFRLPASAQAFSQRAQAVYSQQLRTEATATAATLLRENTLNPEGFEQAWSAYVEGKLEALQDDPTFAAEVGLALTDMGVQKRTLIEGNVFERSQAEIGVELLSSYRQEQNQVQDQILTFPNEAFVVEQISFLQEQIEEIDASAVLAPKVIGDLRMALNDQLYGAFIEGKIRESLETGDMATLQTLHHNLQRGAYFDDNQQALRYAGRIASSMGGDVSRGEINAFQDIGRVMLSRIQEGLAPTAEDLDALDAAFGFIQAYGTEEDQRTFSQNYAGVVFTQQFAPVIQNGAISQIDEALADLQDLQVQLASPEVVRGLRNSLLDRRAELRDAQVSGDLATAGIASVRNTSIADLLSGSQLSVEQFTQEQQYNRQLVAQRLGLDVRQVLPWTFDQIGEFAELMQTAHSGEDMQLFGLAHDAYLSAFGDDIYSAVKAMEGESASLAGGMLLGHVLAGEDLGTAAEIHNLALMGAQMRNVPANQAAFENILQRNAAYTDVVYALSAGSAALNNSITESVSNAMLALQVTGNLPADAKTIIEERLGKVQTQQLGNGTVVASRVFSQSPGVSAAMLAQANQFLEENKMSLGSQYSQLIPVPAGEGSVRFKNMFTGLFLPDAGGVTPVQLRLDTEEAQTIVDEEVFSAQEAFREAEVALENRVALNNRERDLLVKFGTAAGLSEDEAFNYYRAVSFAPAMSMTNLPNGISPMMQAQFVQDDPDRPVGFRRTQEATDAIRIANRVAAELAPTDIRFAATQTDILRGATVAQYADLLKQFNGDQQMALAAMVTSPQEVQDAINIFGMDWFINGLDINAQTFVNRGLGFEELP